LSRFLDIARVFGRGGGAEAGSAHRFLAGENGVMHATPERLDHMVLAAARAAGLPSLPRVLDAGCGLGGTIFRWHARLGGQYDGLTLSPEQHHRATAEAARRGIAADCRFHLRSYQETVTGPYDAAIAIESLAHSPDPAATVANLARALAPGGLLLIVDDMPEGNAQHALLTGFKNGWRCPVLANLTDYRVAIAAAGLDLRKEIDFTSRLRPRPLPWLRVLIALFGLAQRLAPSRTLRDVLGSQHGGFCLEALYRTDAMRYQLLVARKPI